VEFQLNDPKKKVKIVISPDFLQLTMKEKGLFDFFETEKIRQKYAKRCGQMIIIH